MGEGHPEQPDRLRSIERALESEVFQMLARDIAPRAEISAIARVHPLDYIESIRAGTPTQGRTAIDDDTSMSPGSFEAAIKRGPFSGEACRGLRTEFWPFSRVPRLQSAASLSPQNSVSRTTRCSDRVPPGS